MFISRIPLNTARYEARRLIGSPYKLHAAVEKAFPPDAVRKGEQGRILWRLDFSADGKSTWLYVVSPEKPDFTHIVEQAGWPTSSGWEVKDYSMLLGKIAVGQEWAFRLRANPVRQAHADLGRRSNPSVIGKLVGHVTVNHQLDWLVQRSNRSGFEVLRQAKDNNSLSCTVSQRRTERFDHGGSTVTLTTAQYDGLLRVTDADAFRNCMRQGLGRAKSFGCGLLTIAPVQ